MLVFDDQVGAYLRPGLRSQFGLDPWNADPVNFARQFPAFAGEAPVTC